MAPFITGVHTERALNLFIATMVILFTPKICGLIYGLTNKVWRKDIGAWRIVTGTISETLLSVLIAPILMVTQTSAVVSVLSGQDSGWAPQKRGDDGYSFLTTLCHNLPATVLGFVLTIAAIAISPIYAAWLAPATIGLMLSAPVSYFTAKRSAGLRSKRLGLLASPHDSNPPASRTDALRVRPRFADLRPNRLASLLLHPHEQQRRDYLVDPYWPLARSDVHVPLATARARADKAASISEYVDMLSPAEKMALLNSSKDMKMVSIRFAPFRTSSRRGGQTVAAPGAQLLPAETTRSLKVRVDPLRRKP